MVLKCLTANINHLVPAAQRRTRQLEINSKKAFELIVIIEDVTKKYSK